MGTMFRTGLELLCIDHNINKLSSSLFELSQGIESVTKRGNSSMPSGPLYSLTNQLSRFLNFIQSRCGAILPNVACSGPFVNVLGIYELYCLY